MDDGALHAKFGGAIKELMLLRDVLAVRIKANDPRLEQLRRVDATLADLSAIFASLSKAPKTVIPLSRPAQRRRQLRASRLDASTRRLLKRAALVVGISGATAAVGVPLAAATVCNTTICSGSWTGGITIDTSAIVTAFIQNLTADITPPSTVHGVDMVAVGGDGTHNGAGDSGTTGGTGPNLSLTVSETTHQIITTGDNARGIFLHSTGGGGGNGGDGAVGIVTAGSGGAGGTGGTVTLTNSIAVTTDGQYAPGIWLLSQGGNGGNGGDDYVGSGGGAGGAGGNAGTVSLTNHGAITTSGLQAFGIFGQSVGGSGGQGGGANGSFYSAGSGGGANKGNTVTIVNDGAITTGGQGAYGIYGVSVGGFAGSGGNAAGLFGWGGAGSTGGDGGDVAITNAGAIHTIGIGAYGILAQSIGGGGGNGGSAVGLVALGASGNIGGQGNAVSVVNSGSILTEAADARGILAQSIGGGGGNGGFGAGLAGVGGNGSGTSPGGIVYVQNSGAITTGGVNAHAIEAQSVGGGGGDGGMSIGLISIGGAGAAGGDGGAVTIANSGILSTGGADAGAIFAQSIGGGGGSGGNSVAVGPFISFALGGGAGPGGAAGAVNVSSDTGAITTTGARASGITAQSIGGGGGNGGYGISAAAGPEFSIAVGIGGQGAVGGSASTVTVTNSSAITTSDINAYGILAQSIGGGGGNGGMAIAAAATDGVAGTFAVGGHAAGAGDGKLVTLVNNGVITTGGAQSDGILAQSVGGGGGNGGLTISGAVALKGTLGFAIGADGGNGGAGGDVNLTSNGLVSTAGTEAVAILAQSVGGGGGNGSGAISGSLSEVASINVAVGGTGGDGGGGGTVTLANNGGASTVSDNSIGVAAQSIGGGGGNGGFAIGGSLSEGFSGSIAVGGNGSAGGDGSTVSLTGSGAVTTGGFKSTGILAQSIGGGGGNGGFSIAGSIAEDAAASFAIGGQSGGGGNGGAVTLNTSSNVTTGGDLAYGILAQSIGGGGGTGGFAIAGQISAGENIGGLTIAVGGKAGDGGTANTVNLTSGGAILTTGEGAHGVTGQSIGGGGGNGGFAGSFLATFGDGDTANFGVGGNGGSGNSANIVHVTTSGSIHTTGQGAYGVFAQSVGGGGGDGGWGMAITASIGESTGTLVGAIGGNGGDGGLGAAVFLTNSAKVTTQGSNSFGLVAQSIGGGGGNGGFAASGALNNGPEALMLTIGVGGQGGDGNNADVVTLVNSGQISTTGANVNLADSGASPDLSKTNAAGILAQSIGGGGGNGGAAFTGLIGGFDSKNLAVTVGGFGGASGTGSNVLVTNNKTGSIETAGTYGYGIAAQSIGGGGGNGGMALSSILGFGGEGTNLNIGVSIGGTGGDGNTAGLVQVKNDAGITTHGDQSAAILAQSLGGGGGTGGAAVTAIMGVSSVDPDQAESRTVNMTVAVGGQGGDGSNGGQVSLTNTGALTTWAAESQGILAQSIGGGGGAGGDSNTISLVVGGACSLPLVCEAPDNAKRNINLQATVGGNGGGASDGGTVNVNNSGAIVTHGDNSAGIFAQSLGGGGGIGGNGTIGTGGLLPFPAEIIFLPVSMVPIYQDISLAVGGNSGSSGNGGAVTLTNSGAITTSGNNSIALEAMSTGGGGGEGGIGSTGLTGKIGIGGAGGAAGNGGTVNLTSSGALTTTGTASYGIFAQSVGGGGGRAGNVNRGFASQLGSQYGIGIGLAFGQSGGDGGNGAAVTVANNGAITTSGDGATGIFAQSVGGGGGQEGSIGNFDVAGLGGFFVGSVGGVGNGAAVTLTQSGNVTTHGLGAYGVFAQSAGGQGTGDQVGITLTGSISTSGDDAVGLMAQSVGLNGAGNISLNDSGNVGTTGARAIGVELESFGAAGATPGSTTVTAIDATGLLGITGKAVAGNITLTQTGTTTTTGADAHGILVQSVSTQGKAGNITITYNGSINASGADADGIVAQSSGVAISLVALPGPVSSGSTNSVPNNGNIAITINGSGTVSGGSGTGAAVRFIGGSTNTLTNYGTLTTAKGYNGVTVVGGSGNEDFENYGTLVGQVQLGGGTNVFNNHVGATIAAGTALDLGGAAKPLDNVGIFSPGGKGSILTTALNGSFIQPSTGAYAVDVDLLGGNSDRINATGSASLAGTVQLSFLNVPGLKPGTTSVTILSAAGGLTNNGAALSVANSAVAQYALAYPNTTDAVLSVNVNFAPAGALNPNDTAIGNYINAIQSAGSSPTLAPLLQTLFTLPDGPSLNNFYQTLSPAPFLADLYALSQTGSLLTDSMLSCHPESGDAWRFSEEDECSWLRVTPRTLKLTATSASMGSNSRATDFTAGHQFVLDENYRLGLAASFSNTQTSVENHSTSHGQSIAGGAVVKGLFNPLEFVLGVSGGQAVLHTSRTVAAGTVATSRQDDSFLNERARVSYQFFGDDSFYARPLAELNATQGFNNAFHETGAGPLDLFVGSSHPSSGVLGAGFELGGEFAFDPALSVLRPFVGYEFKHTVWGDTLNLSAMLEGAPAGVAPFNVAFTPDRDLHQVTAGLDVIKSDNMNFRFQYNGTFGDKTRQDVFGFKLSLPF